MLELENSILIILRTVGDVNPPGNLYELTIFHHSIQVRLWDPIFYYIRCSNNRLMIQHFLYLFLNHFSLPIVHKKMPDKYLRYHFPRSSLQISLTVTSPQFFGLITDLSSLPIHHSCFKVARFIIYISDGESPHFLRAP